MKQARHDAGEVRAILVQMDENAAWDHIQSRDIDPKIIDLVAGLLTQGIPPGTIAQKHLGFTGKNDRRWKKIQAYFRQGFRADAEAYLFNQTQRYFRFIEKAEATLEDAFENGVPITTADKNGNVTITRVKGATKELGSFLKNYSEAIAVPVKLWKEYGAIGDKKDAGSSGTTILVQNNIQMADPDEIRRHQEKIAEKAKALEMKREEYEVKS